MGFPTGAIVYEVNNSREAVGGGNALVSYGTGGSFITTPTPPFGSHAWKHNLTNNGDKFPTTPQSACAGKTFSLEWRIWFRTKDATAPGVNNANCMARNAAAEAGKLVFQILTNNGTWNPWSANFNMYLAGNQHFLGTFSGTTYTNGTANAWNRMTLCFEKNSGNANGVYKLYINGTLTFTSANTYANIFDTAEVDFRLGGYIGTDYGSYSCDGLDRIIFLPNVNTAGVEIVPSSEPTITNINPENGSAIGGTSVTITGTQFAAGAAVLFDASSATDIVVVSATEITCTTPAHAVGAVDITVTNADTGTYTLTDGFTYTTPTITAISPDTTPVFTTPNVTITGTNFVTGATITFNAIPATNVIVVNSTTITCTVPSMDTASLAVVTVTNPDGGYFNETTLFTFTMSSPEITDISPISASVYATPTVTITGTDFVSGASVIIGNTAATNVVVVNSTTITCTLPARSVAAQVNVKVTNTDTGTDTINTAFEYLAPTITSVTPEIGNADGGEAITIEGIGFHSGLTVTIGGIAATDVTVVNDTTITCTTPEHAAGSADVVITDQELLRCETAIGTEGAGDGQLSNPFDVRISPAGFVFISDMYNTRVQKFDTDGNYISKFGTYGSGNGQFNSPSGMAIDAAGNIFVTDVAPGPWPFKHSVQKFTADGTFVLKFDGNGTGNGQFDCPYSVAVDSQGNIFVTDWGNNRVQKFSAAGTYMSQFGTYGTGNGQLDGPEFIFIDDQDNIYVGDIDNSRVQKFSPSGVYISKFGTYGSGPGQLSTGVGGITIDAQGDIYVVDSLNNRVEKFDSSGNFILQFGSYGEGAGQFIMPNGIDMDAQGNIYVIDSLNNRVQKFTHTYKMTNAFNFVEFSSTPALGGLNGGTFLTITGDFFVEGMTVAIDGAPCYAVVVNDAQTITAQSPVGNIAVGLPVTITYPDGGATIEVGFFSYTDDAYVDSDPIFEKNKLASSGAWLTLLEVTGPGITSPIRLVRNTEDITWGGYSWKAFPFIAGELSSNTNGEIPNLQIQICNTTREIQAVLEETDGAVGTTIKVIRIHTDHTEAMWEGTYAVLYASCDEEWATFTCGLEHSTTSRRPTWLFQKYMCRFVYGDIFCNVADATKTTYPTCGKTLAACTLRLNAIRFGGELNIPGNYYG